MLLSAQESENLVAPVPPLKKKGHTKLCFTLSSSPEYVALNFTEDDEAKLPQGLEPETRDLPP